MSRTEWAVASADASLLVAGEAGHFPLVEAEPDVAQAIHRFPSGEVLITVEKSGRGTRILRKGADARRRAAGVRRSVVAPAPGEGP